MAEIPEDILQNPFGTQDQGMVDQEQADLFQQAADFTPQPEPEQAPQEQSFKRWDEIKDDPNYDKLEQKDKEQIFSNWKQYAIGNLSKVGALSTEEDAKKVDDFFNSVAEKENFPKVRTEAPSYVGQLIEQGQSGLNSLQSGVVGYGAAIGAADPAKAAEIIAANNLKTQSRYVSPEMQEYGAKNQGFFEAAKDIVTNPIDIMLPMFAQSIGSNLPAMGASLVAGATAGAVAAPPTAGAATPAVGIAVGLGTSAVLGGVTDALVSFDQLVNEEVRKRGIDPLDPKAIQSVLEDSDFQKRAVAYASTRGAVITATELGALGLGSLIAGPAVKVAETGVKEAVTAGKLAKEFAKQAPIQAAAEGVGEAAAQASAQVAVGEKVNVEAKQVAEEIFAGLPMSGLQGAGVAYKSLIENNSPVTADEDLRQKLVDYKAGEYAKILSQPATDENIEKFYNGLTIGEKAKILGVEGENAALTGEQNLFNTLAPGEKTRATEAFKAGQVELVNQQQQAKLDKAEIGATPPVLEPPVLKAPAPVTEPPVLTPTPEALVPAVTPEAPATIASPTNPLPVTPAAKVVLAESAPATLQVVQQQEAPAPAPVAPAPTPAAVAPAPAVSLEAEEEIEVWHGSPTKGIETLKEPKEPSRQLESTLGRGLYFAGSEELSKKYAKGKEGQIYKVKIKPGKTIDLSKLSEEEVTKIRGELGVAPEELMGAEGNRVFPVRENTENGKRTGTFEYVPTGITRRVGGILAKGATKPVMLQDIFKKLGYDSATFDLYGRGKEWVVFDPNRISQPSVVARAEVTAPAPKTPAVQKLPPTKKQVTALAKLGYLPADIEGLDRAQAKDILANQIEKQKAQGIEAEAPATGQPGVAQAQPAVGEAGQPVAPATTEPTTQVPVQERLDKAKTELEALIKKIGAELGELELDAESVSQYFGGTLSPQNELQLRALLNILNHALANAQQTLKVAEGRGRTDLKKTFTNLKKVKLRREGYGGGVYANPRDVFNLDTLYLDPDQLLRSFASKGVSDPASFFVKALSEEVLHANHGLAMYQAFLQTNPASKTQEAFQAFYDAQNKEIENSLSLDQIKEIVGKYAQALGVTFEGKTKEQVIAEFNKGRPGRLAEEYLRGLIQQRITGSMTEDTLKAFATRPILRSLGALRNYFAKLIGLGTKRESRKTYVDKYYDAIVNLLTNSSPSEIRAASQEAGSTIPGSQLASSIDPNAILQSQETSANKKALYDEVAKELGPKNKETGEGGLWRLKVIGGLKRAFRTTDPNDVESAVYASIPEAVETFNPEAGTKFESYLFQIARQKILEEKEKLTAQRALEYSLQAPGFVNSSMENLQAEREAEALQKTREELTLEDVEDKVATETGPKTLEEEVKTADQKIDTAIEKEVAQETGTLPTNIAEDEQEIEEVNLADGEQISSIDAEIANKRTARMEAELGEAGRLLADAAKNLNLTKMEVDILQFTADPKSSPLTRAQLSDKYGLNNIDFDEIRDDVIRKMREQLVAGGVTRTADVLASSIDPNFTQALLAREAKGNLAYHGTNLDQIQSLLSGVRQGTNFSPRFGGQAFGAEVVLVYPKNELSFEEKTYQNDLVLQKQSQVKPIAVMFDRENFPSVEAKRSIYDVMEEIDNLPEDQMKTAVELYAALDARDKTMSNRIIDELLGNPETAKRQMEQLRIREFNGKYYLPSGEQTTIPSSVAKPNARKIISLAREAVSAPEQATTGVSEEQAISEAMKVVPQNIPVFSYEINPDTDKIEKVKNVRGTQQVTLASSIDPNFTQALNRALRTMPDDVVKALAERTYIPFTDDDVINKANKFVDENSPGGDVMHAKRILDGVQNMLFEERVGVLGVIGKRLRNALFAHVARMEANGTTPEGQALRQYLSNNLTEVLSRAQDLGTRAGQDLRSMRMLASMFLPYEVAKLYTGPISEQQKAALANKEEVTNLLAEIEKLKGTIAGLAIEDAVGKVLPELRTGGVFVAPPDTNFFKLLSAFGDLAPLENETFEAYLQRIGIPYDELMLALEDSRAAAVGPEGVAPVDFKKLSASEAIEKLLAKDKNLFSKLVTLRLKTNRGSETAVVQDNFTKRKADAPALKQRNQALQLVFDFFNTTQSEKPSSQEAVEEAKDNLPPLVRLAKYASDVITGRVIRSLGVTKENMPKGSFEKLENQIRKMVNAQFKQELDPKKAATEDARPAEQRLLDMVQRIKLAEQVFNEVQTNLQGQLNEDNRIIDAGAEGRLSPEQRKNLEELVTKKFDAGKVAGVDSLLKKMIDFKAEARKHMTQRGASLQSILTLIKEKLPELSEQQANDLATQMAERYEAIVKKDGQRQLENIVKRVGERASRDPKTTIQQLMELINLGAFDQEKFYNAIADRFNLPTWDPAVVDKIKGIADQMEKMPEGSDQRATKGVELQALIAEELYKQEKGWDAIGRKLDVAAAIWKAGVLSGPPTQLVNLGATHLNVLFELLTEARAYYKASKAIGKKATFGEFFNDALNAYVQAVGKMGVEQASDAFATGLSRFRNETQSQLSPLEMIKFDQKKPWNYKNYLAAWKIVGRAMAAADTYNSVIANEAKTRMAARYALMKDGLTSEQATKKMNELFDNNSTAMKAIEDQVGKEEAAGQFGTLAGLKPGTMDYASQKRKIEAGRRRRYLQLREQYIADEGKIGNEGIAKIRNFTQKATFNNQPTGMIGYLGEAVIGQIAGKTKLLTPFAAFPRTIANIINSSLDYTPYGWARANGFSLGNLSPFIRNSTYAFEKPEKGSVEYHQLQAKAFFGSLITFSIIGMAMRDMDKDWDEAYFAVTGRGPTDANKREQLRQSGWTENTVKIGPLRFKHTDFPGLNLVFGSLALVSDQWRYGKLSEKDFGTVAATAALSVGNTILDKNLLSGAKVLFDAVSEGGDPGDKAKRLLQSYTGGYLNPGMARWLTKTLNIGADGKVGVVDYKELNSTTGGWLIGQTPLAVVFGKPMLNRLGEEIRDYPWTATSKRLGFLPEVKEHPVFTPLIRAGLFVPGASINSKIKDFKGGKLEQRKMTREEYYDYSKYNGEYLKRILTPATAKALANVAQTNQAAAQKRLEDLAQRARDYATSRIETQIRSAKK